MRYHSRILTLANLRDAITLAELAAPGSYMVECVQRKSKSHGVAYEIKLAGNGKHVTRHTNSGGYGAVQGEFAAGYAAHGFFIAALYDIDPNMVVGSGPKNAIYEGKDDFYAQTTMSAESEPDPNNIYGEILGVVCPFDTDIAITDRRAIYLAFGRRGGRPSNNTLAGRKIGRAIYAAVNAARSA